ncbi:MAG: hypothetical protein ACOX65_01840 [Anaerotruncus rubiinfantis]|jgi:hypothetical protein
MAIVHEFEFEGAKVFIHDDVYARASEKEIEDGYRELNQTAARICRDHILRENGKEV